MTLPLVLQAAQALGASVPGSVLGEGMQEEGREDRTSLPGAYALGRETDPHQMKKIKMYFVGHSKKTREI